MSLNDELTSKLKERGADLIGFGDLTKLPREIRKNLPVGISAAVLYPKDVIKGIADLPTQAYQDWYDILNARLDDISKYCAKELQEMGFTAVAQHKQYVGENKKSPYETLLPHKTVATRAGLGWIGKCALLVTDSVGSMIRLTSILTDAPLETAEPVNDSKCGSCDVCRSVCPGRAVSGKLWSAGTPRAEIFDYAACEKTGKERSLAGFGVATALCGKCIESCPRTQKYLKLD